MRVQQQQTEADEHGAEDLVPEFLARGQAQISLFRDLCVVIDKADGSEAYQAEQRQPDILIAEIRP